MTLGDLSYPQGFTLGVGIMFALYGLVKFLVGAWTRFKRENLP